MTYAVAGVKIYFATQLVSLLAIYNRPELTANSTQSNPLSL